MSFNDVYEFIQGEYQQVTRIRQEPVSTADPTFFKDLNLVKWAGFSIEIWSAETGGTQLVQGLDYELQYLDVSASGPAGEPVYSGYDILTPLYYNIPLYQTANIVGAYTTRPYRPSYNVITADTTVTPASMDDSVIADATGGSFTVTIADGFHLNQRYSIICKGLGTVTVVGTGISAASFTGVGVSWLWDGNEWMPLAAPGAREGGIYYDWELVYTNEGAPSTTIPNVSTYGEGLSYAAVEFTYGGESVRASGTFALYDDGIDRYTILANDVSGSDSTMNLRYDSGTDTLEAVETGSDFTNINLFGLYHWTEYTYGGYGAWTNTAEAPTYGEPIVSGQELYLDGTKEFISSDGNAPVVDVVDYLPAVINVDGAETPEPNSKWPGQRGAYGFFGEYENNLVGYPADNPDAGSSIEGDWLKILATADASSSSNCSASWTFTATSTTGYAQVLVKRGIATNNQTQITFGATGNVLIDWVAKTIVSSEAATDAGSLFISDEIALVKSYPGTVGGVAMAVYASNFTSTTSGDYSYFKDWMFVDLPYAVPFVAGVHQPAKLQYNKDWSQSTEWTIQGWVEPVGDGALAEIIFKAGGFSPAHRWQIYATGGVWTTFTNDGTSFSEPWGIQPPATGEWHFKVVYTSGVSIAVYVNALLAQTTTTNVAISDSIAKSAYVGSSQDFDQHLIGYIQDLTITPGIDTSDAHYLSGLPFYSPSKTYGKNASWSIDARGNISGNNQVAGVIIQDVNITDFSGRNQHVTKWDTGRMEISGYYEQTSASAYTIIFAEPFSGGNLSFSLTNRTSSSMNLSITEYTDTTCSVRAFDSNGALVVGLGYFSVTGRWK